MRENFKDRLARGPVLFDGGTGTTLYEHGIFIHCSFDQLNLTDPGLIRSVQEDFARAGAQVLETNTFAANPLKLKGFGLADSCRAINLAGAKIAREAGGDECYVAGAVGPLGTRIEPIGTLSLREANGHFLSQTKALAEGGVDLFICETFVYMIELEQAVRACREAAPELPVIAQLTLGDDGRSLTGAPPEAVLRDLLNLGADVVGINCSVGPHAMLDWLEKVSGLTDVPLSVMPNAGRPRNVDGRNIYLSTPEYMATFTTHFLRAGAHVVGGCCGVSPVHMKAIARAFRAASAMKIDVRRPVAELKIPPDIRALPLTEKSRLGEKLSRGTFVTLVELVAPRGISAERELKAAERMRDLGVDCINIPDGPRATARMSALAMAVQIEREIGVETVLHFACRDRNVIGMQGDLLGAWALGVRNLLAITGDPPKLGNYPDVTAVFDVDSIGLVNILNLLNHGLDVAGDPIGDPASFCIGVGANPGAPNIEEEISRLEAKVKSGAEFIITQPVFEISLLEKFLRSIEGFRVPLLAGIWPLQSVRNAEFMNNEVPGCHVPDEIIRRLRVCETRDEARAEGNRIARETYKRLKGVVQGVQISAPFGRVEAVAAVLGDEER